MTVDNGLQALRAFDEGGFDLVLMDVQMPEFDGLEATAEIRKREAARGQGERIPIVALTASALPADEGRCQAAGMDDFLAKPITLQSLGRALGTWLESPRGVEQ